MPLHVREPCRHHLPALQNDAGEHPEANREESERTEPEDPRQRFERRIVENEISVTRHHVVANLRIGCALLDLLVNDQTQIGGEIDRGIRDGFVLADETAKARFEAAHATGEFRGGARSRGYSSARVGSGLGSNVALDLRVSSYVCGSLSAGIGF